MNARVCRCSKRLIALTLACLASVGNAHAASASTEFVVTWPGVWLRRAPSVLAPRIALAEQGSRYPVLARSSDGTWVAVAYGAAQAWIPSGFGNATNPSQVPAVKLTFPPAVRNTNTHPLPTWITMTVRGRLIYQQAVKAGRNPRLFTVAGDSNSAWERSIGRIAAGSFDLSRHAHLNPIIARFDPSFAHVSLAVRGGIGAVHMFDPAYAPSPPCLPTEGMFVCELRRSNASIVFIQLGTGDSFAWREFEANLRRMINHAITQAVLPVLVTKADEMESIHGGASLHFINDTIRRVAREEQLPIADFYIATRALPTVPNPDLPHRPFTQNGLVDEWGYYFHLSEEGFALRILTHLWVLDALTRGLKE
ncbi:MAG: hypothetical protein NZL91_02830 [Thermoflexales bacterium]|nr:hypothetical protein [Thermoflexales bacterium]MCS7325644.1 hypothetical protein [Thermoflexales bacterium]MCX7939417.1 hypothetical protein [Thermoflexales bacterium]MDW8053652.1 hypothetical protein [Anaerolineae bacterium]